MNAWSSYLPDGRPIHVTRIAQRWLVACDDVEANDPDLRAAMRRASGLTDPERPSSSEDDRVLSRWVERHAAQIESEAG